MESDARCLQLATTQFGLITREQALLYLSADAIRRRCQASVWFQILPGVFVIGGAPSSVDQRVMATVLWVRSKRATKDLSCASHGTAAYLAGLLPAQSKIHVATPRSLAPPKHSIVVHRVVLDPLDITVFRGMPATTAARTLLDLGATHRSDEVESVLETALRRGSVSLPRLRWQLERCGGRGHRGSATLRRLLDDRNKGYIPSESELELRLFRILRRARLPLPIKQKVVKDQGHFIARVDFAYPERGLIIEVHGWKYHSAKKRWESDLQRGNSLVLRGARVLVFTWSDVNKTPDYVLGATRRALASGPGAQGSLRL